MSKPAPVVALRAVMRWGVWFCVGVVVRWVVRDAVVRATGVDGLRCVVLRGVEYMRFCVWAAGFAVRATAVPSRTAALATPKHAKMFAVKIRIFFISGVNDIKNAYFCASK